MEFKVKEEKDGAWNATISVIPWRWVQLLHNGPFTRCEDKEWLGFYDNSFDNASIFAFQAW